jgi:hypothetical protein
MRAFYRELFFKTPAEFWMNFASDAITCSAWKALAGQHGKADRRQPPRVGMVCKISDLVKLSIQVEI